MGAVLNSLNECEGGCNENNIMKIYILSFLALLATLVFCQDINESSEDERFSNRMHPPHSSRTVTNSSDTILHRAKRAIFTTIAIITGLIATTTSATIGTVDLATDSEAFYPSIARHKRNINYYRNLIKGAVPDLRKKQRSLKSKVDDAEKLQKEFKLWATNMAMIKEIIVKHNITFNMHGESEIVADLDELLIIPQSMKTEIGALAIGMLTVNWVITAISWGTTSYQLATGALVGTSAIVGSALSIIAIPLSGVAIWMVVDNGKKKRDAYRDHENRLRDQWKDIQNAKQRIYEAEGKIQRYFNQVETKMEKMLSMELDVVCKMDTQTMSLLDTVKIVSSSWTKVRIQFQKLDNDWTNIRNWAKVLKEGDDNNNMIFRKILRKYPNLGEFILKTMKNLNFDVGTWGAWKDMSACKEDSCGISRKMMKRQCSTQSCIGNTYSSVICNVYYGKMSKQECQKTRSSADYYFFKPHYKKIKKMCQLTHLPIVD